MLLAVLVGMLLAAAAPAAAQAQADALVIEAFDLSYNLDHDQAIAKLTEGAKQYPQRTSAFNARSPR